MYLDELEMPQELLVLCRKQDAHPDIVPFSNLYLGKLEHQQVTFHYLDIYEWIAAQLLRMTASARRLFFVALQGYVEDKNTAVRVKYTWAALVTGNLSDT